MEDDCNLFVSPLTLDNLRLLMISNPPYMYPSTVHLINVNYHKIIR